MRILLVQPDHQPSPISFRLVATPEPLALELLAAMVPDHEVGIVDLRIDPDLDGALARFQPDLVAVTALTTEVYGAAEVLARAKDFWPGIFTAVGGQHATLLPEDFQLPFVDAICLGEGEFVFARLVQALAAEEDLGLVPNLVWRADNNRFMANRRELPTVDGDFIPKPRRDLVGHYRAEYSWLYDKPDTAIVTGRGCPYRCNFCSVWEFYQGKTRQMCARRVVEEVLEVRTPHVTFLDDNFLLNARREHEIADRIRAEGLKLRFGMECRSDSIVRHPDLIEKWAELGLENVLLGIEGVSDSALKRINKRNTTGVNEEAIRILHANGVMIWGAFIVDPDWTADHFKVLLDYVRGKPISHPQFTVLTPLPGTQLYRERRHELLTDDYTCFDTLHAVVPTRLPREDFYRHFASLYRQPNFDLAYDLVRQGRLTIDRVRFGRRILQQLGNWEYYVEGDPILGNRSPKNPVPAGIKNAGLVQASSTTFQPSSSASAKIGSLRSP